MTSDRERMLARSDLGCDPKFLRDGYDGAHRPGCMAPPTGLGWRSLRHREGRSLNTRLVRLSRTAPCAGFALALLIAGSALAQDTGGEPLEIVWFEQIDTDSDDTISGEELDAMRTRRFVQIDLDRDRALTPAEFMQDLPNGETGLIERREKRFAMMDRDGDGAVDVVEYIGFGGLVMELLDADGDGHIRRAEFTHAVAFPE
jgi:hypothetical protein